MKKETEFNWLINLKNSPFRKGLFYSSKSGCIHEFEKWAGASENNKEFRIWFKQMVEEGVFEYSEKRKNVKEVDTFSIVVKKLNERLVENPRYQPTINALEEKFLLRVAK